jgi:chloride channel protein, CIC family
VMHPATPAVPGDEVDSVTATRSATRLFLAAVLVGVLAGLATWLFVAASHYGIDILWHRLPASLPGLPPAVVSVAVVAVLTVLATTVVVLSRGRPADMGRAEAEFDRDGRIGYRHLPAGVAYALTSLWSGAVIGPEAALIDLNGAIGTWVADRLALSRDHVRTLTYAGVAGAFAAFFGAAPVGALLAAELISPKAVSISRTQIVAGLAAGASGWVVYAQLGGQAISPILHFAPTTVVSLLDLAIAVPLGILGCLVGLVYGGSMLKVRVRTQPLRARPWLAGLAGGTVIAATAVLWPDLLFSGQEATPTLMSSAAAFGVVGLVAIGLAKLALNVWTLSTAYFGGPIFPAIFAGTSFGLAINLALPGVPEHVAVLGMVAGLVVSAAVAPLSVTVFLALIVDPSLTSVIAIAAVAAFIVRQLIAPTLPGIYRATRAREDELAG